MTDIGPSQPAQPPLRAADVMSQPVLMIELDESMQDAWAAMMAGSVRHLVVCDGGGCVGVLDDRTLFAHWPTGLFGVRSTPVRDLLRDSVRTVTGQTPLSAVAALMVAHDVDAVAVVSESGVVVGIVTGRDLAGAVATYGISRPVEPDLSAAGSGPRTLPSGAPAH